jgi:hypothetical protein
LRFDGIGHFEIVSDLPLLLNAENAQEAECVVVWVRPRHGAHRWRGLVEERAHSWSGGWRRFECTALVLMTTELELPVEAPKHNEGGMMPGGGRVRGRVRWVGRRGAAAAVAAF